jgi:hypothetical protein
MYIGVNLIIFEHKLSSQPIPVAFYRFQLLGQPARGKGTRLSGPESLASPLFGGDARAPDRDSMQSVVPQSPIPNLLALLLLFLNPSDSERPASWRQRSTS